MCVIFRAIPFTSATSLACGSALAAPPLPLTLQYEAPPECPLVQSVVERTYALMHYRATGSVTAAARITRDSNGYRLELQVEGGKQNVVSGSCESLAQTLAVILALAVDMQAQESTQREAGRHADANIPSAKGATAGEDAAPMNTYVAPEAPPSREQTPAAVAAPTANVGIAGQPPERLVPVRAVTPSNYPLDADRVTVKSTHGNEPSHRNAELHLATQFLTEYGMLRGLAEGPSLGLWLDLDQLSLTASARWLIPQWKPMPGSAQARGGTISFLGGELGPCLALSKARLFHACVGVEAGDMMGKGLGVTNTQLGHGLWLAGTSAVAWRPKLWSKLSADVRLGMAIPVKRPAFGFDGYAWRFEPYPWSIRLSSGFSWF